MSDLDEAMKLAREVADAQPAFEVREKNTSTMFDPSHHENEECDACGTRVAVVSMGHGSYSCESCYGSWWCPECGYDARRKPHACVTAEQKKIHDRDSWRMWVELDGFEEAEKEWGQDPDKVALARALLALAEQRTAEEERADVVAWLRARAGRLARSGLQGLADQQRHDAMGISSGEHVDAAAKETEA